MKMNYINKIVIFGSFVLSAKEPYTIMLCPSLLSLSASVLASLLSMYSAPYHMVKPRNFTPDVNMYPCA